MNQSPEAAAGAVADPVFVLCAGRSGSTLLRFVLDAHPDLACPPETRLAETCSRLAAVWSQLDRTGPVGGVDRLADAALRGVRGAVEAMIAPYLDRRGKRRFCDKSLGTAEYASLLVRLFPGARFLCLFRHPMDVIASGIEATPWGLNGFGFDRYAAAEPGNAVQALARYWVDHVAAIRRVQALMPERCHQVRYEDLVTDPQAVADGVFDFLGVPGVPAVAERCFSAERERSGPADYKIWHTSAISDESIGRGWSVPAHLISRELTATVNRFAGELGYRPVDGRWGISPSAPDMVEPVGAAPATEEEDLLSAGPAPEGYRLIGQRLEAAFLQRDAGFPDRWRPCSGDVFLVTATAPGGRGHARWRVDLTAHTVTMTTSRNKDAATGAAWDLVGSVETWTEVLTGGTNLSVALRARRLRYCHNGRTPDPAEQNTRLGMLGELLGLTSWRAAG
jgi:hypothetical protein